MVLAVGVGCGRPTATENGTTAEDSDTSTESDSGETTTSGDDDSGTGDPTPECDIVPEDSPFRTKWTQVFDHGFVSSLGSDLKATADDSAIVVGTWNADNDVSGIFLAKHSSSGSLHWLATHEPPRNTSNPRVSPAADGSYVVSAWLTGDPQETWVGRFDAVGAIVWEMVIDDAVEGIELEYHRAAQLYARGDSRIWIAGTSIDGDMPETIVSWILEVSADGQQVTPLWNDQEDDCRGMTRFSPAEAGGASLSSGGVSCIRRHLANGEVQWSTHPDIGKPLRVTNVVAMEDGGVFWAGDVEEESAPGQVRDAVVGRLDPDGAVEWWQNVGFCGKDRSVALARRGSDVFFLQDTGRHYHEPGYESLLRKIGDSGEIAWDEPMPLLGDPITAPAPIAAASATIYALGDGVDSYYLVGVGG